MTSELWSENLKPGEHWSGVLRRGTLAAHHCISEARANVAAMMYNYESLPERYSMPDTLKAQHTAFLSAGCVCYSDMGRILCSITADSCGWHDTLCGVSDATMVADRCLAPVDSRSSATSSAEATAATAC